MQDKSLREAEFAHADAYVRRVRRLREELGRLAGAIWDEAHHDRNGLHGTDAVSAALACLQPSRRYGDRTRDRWPVTTQAGAELRNGWGYREAELIERLDPARVDTGEVSTIHWYEPAREAAVTVEPVGNPNDYCDSHPIEDVALVPHRCTGPMPIRRRLFASATGARGVGPFFVLILEQSKT